MSGSEPSSTCVLDASALLALLHGEPGSEVVQAVLDRSVMSTVNWSEVCQRSVARGIELGGLRADLEALGLTLVPFTADDAEQAATLWPVTRSSGLSLGDRACLALAHRLDQPALTADRAWSELGLDAEVRLIR